METSLETIGTLEYVLDKYSKVWSWKISGDRAVNMISRLVPEAWYGENVNEVIIPDSTENIKQRDASSRRIEQRNQRFQ